MFCRHCGNKIVEGAKFCKHCGHEVGQTQMPPTVTEQTGGSPQGQQQMPPTITEQIGGFQQGQEHMNPVSQSVVPQGQVGGAPNTMTQGQPVYTKQQVVMSQSSFSVLSDFKHEFLERYFTFTGRTSRRAFIGYSLIQWTIGLVVIAIAQLAVMSMDSLDAILYGTSMLMIGIFIANGIFIIPNVAIAVRRLHDTGHSGWFYLLLCVPIGNLYIVYLLFSSGDTAPNAYGQPEQFDRSSQEAIAKLDAAESYYKKEVAIIAVISLIFLGLIVKPIFEVADVLAGGDTKMTMMSTKSKKTGSDISKSKAEQPAPPVDPNVQIANEAKEALLAYHQAISNQEIIKAYNLMTANRQQLLGGLDSMRQGYSTTISSTIVDAKPSYVDPNKVIFQYKLNAKDALDGRIKLQTFTGEVTMVKVNGQWYLDDMTGTLVGSSYQ